MKRPPARLRHLRTLLLAALIPPLLLVVLQQVVAHRSPPFSPDYVQADLMPLFTKTALTDGDYQALFLQTGLGRSGVDRLLAMGEPGMAQLEEIQATFFAPVNVTCEHLYGAFLMEDHLRTQDGSKASAAPLVPLHPGDILLTYSTHAFGWRHGHAGLVVSAEGGLASLEATLIGTDSILLETAHWRDYSNYLILRLREMTPELQEELSDYSLTQLCGVPYRLTSGLWGGQEVGDPRFGAQCAYLGWYAFQHFGYDLDSDGGRLVTVNDLAHSPLLEVVQLYGLNPRDWSPF